MATPDLNSFVDLQEDELALSNLQEGQPQTYSKSENRKPRASQLSPPVSHHNTHNRNVQLHKNEDSPNYTLAIVVVGGFSVLFLGSLGWYLYRTRRN